MEAPLVLQFSIALFTGMVASSFIPQVRRSIPRAVEVGMWIGLIGVCIAGVVSVTDRNARELTASVAWAAEQLVNATVGLMGAGMGAWISDHRFGIATAVLVLAGLDVVALGMVRSWRASARQQPRIRLREWMEVPLAPQATAIPARAERLEVAKRRLSAAATFASAWLVASILTVAIWMRDVVLPREAGRLVRAAAAGREQSKARLESLRDGAAQVQFAARAWYDAAAAPTVSAAAGRAAGAFRAAAAARRTALVREGAEGHVVDIQALLSAPFGWYGPLLADPDIAGEVEEDGAQPRSDRLAS